MKPLLFARMHGRGKMAAAPASDAATRGGRRCLRVEPRPVFFFFSFPDSRRLALIQLQRAPTRAEPDRFTPIRAESDRIGRILVCFGRKKEIGRRKKKKKYLKLKIPMDLIRLCRHLHWP